MHMAQLMPLPLTSLATVKSRLVLPFSYWFTRGSPGQRAVKLVCVCVCVFALLTHFCYSFLLIFSACNAWTYYSSNMLFVAEVDRNLLNNFHLSTPVKFCFFAARQRARNWQGKMPDCELIN